MRLHISSKLASVHSETEVANEKGEILYTAQTDPLSAPRLTRVVDGAGAEIARYTTTRTDTKDRAYRISMADGSELDLKRKFRVSAKTNEAVIRVQPVGWTVVTRRAWTCRFEIRDASDRVVARAKQVPALRGDVYDVYVLDGSREVRIALLSLIARTVIREDSPSPV